MSEKPKRLNLDILYPDQRAELIKELEGATVVITDTLAKAYRDGKELDAHLDMIGGVLRMDNPEGIYRVSADGDEPDQGEQQAEPFEHSMAKLASEVWAKRNPGITDAQAVANLRDIYSHRRTAMTA